MASLGTAACYPQEKSERKKKREVSVCVWGGGGGGGGGKAGRWGFAHRVDVARCFSTGLVN